MRSRYIYFITFLPSTVFNILISPQLPDRSQQQWTLGLLNRQKQASLESQPTGYTSVKHLGYLQSGLFGQESLCFVVSQVPAPEKISRITLSSCVSRLG